MASSKVVSLALLASLGVGVCADRVFAIAQFKKEFENLYVKKEPATAEEKALAGAVASAKCNVCHLGEKKKERNAYGQALDKLLDKKADIKNPQKIQEALKTVEAEKSNPDDANSPTFGDLLKQGKLPAGN